MNDFSLSDTTESIADSTVKFRSVLDKINFNVDIDEVVSVVGDFKYKINKIMTLKPNF